MQNLIYYLMGVIDSKYDGACQIFIKGHEGYAPQYVKYDLNTVTGGLR